MMKYLGVILAFFLSIQNVYAANVERLIGQGVTPQGDPKPFSINPAWLAYQNKQTTDLYEIIKILRSDSPIIALRVNMKLVIDKAKALILDYDDMLKEFISDEDRTFINTEKNKIKNIYDDYINMYNNNRPDKFNYIQEDENYITLYAAPNYYRVKKGSISNLSRWQIPKYQTVLKRVAEQKGGFIAIPTVVQCTSSDCMAFKEIIVGKPIMTLLGTSFALLYDDLAIENAEKSDPKYLAEKKAELLAQKPQAPTPQVEVPSIYPYQTLFQGQIATFTQVGDLINIELTNPTALQKGSKIITAATLRFKMPTSALTTQLYIPNPDPSKSRIESTLGELISTAGSSLMGRSMKVLCQSSQGCAYDKNSGIISGTLYYSDISGDDIRKTIVDKRNAEGLKFTSITGKLLNAAGGYIRFNDDSGALIATKKASITNLASLQRYEKVINFVLTNPTQYQLPMTLTCIPNNVCSKNEVKDSSGKVVGIEIVGPTTLAMNPGDMRKIQAAIAAPQQAQVVTDEAKRVADINAAPKAVYRTFPEFKEALYKARGNPQAIEGIFKQVLEDLNQGRMRGFSGQNGMFDLAGMGLTSLPRTLPEVFNKSSAFVLNLSENNLSTIQGLERIPSGKLRGIHLYNNRNLTSLAPLVSHPLEFLIAFNTSVSRDEAGLVALSRGPSSQTLKELSLDNTELKSITILMNFQKLSKLSVRNNPVILKQNQVIANALTTLQNRGVQLFVK